MCQRWNTGHMAGAGRMFGCEIRFGSRGLVWMLAGGLALCSPSWAKADEIVETTICEIITDDAKFGGRVISVLATAHTSYHGDWLDDQSCLRRGAIALRLPPAEKWRGEMKRLGRAMNHGFGPQLAATGRFIGLIVVYPGDKNSFEDMPLTILDLHDVRDLVIGPETCCGLNPP